MESKETIITLKVEASKANQEVEGVKKNIDKTKKATNELTAENEKASVGYGKLGEAINNATFGALDGLQNLKEVGIEVFSAAKEQGMLFASFLSKGLPKGFRISSVAAKGFAIALAATGITLITGAVAVLVDYFQNFEGAARLVDKVLAGLSVQINGVIDVMKALFTLDFDGVVKEFNAIEGKVRETVKAVDDLYDAQKRYAELNRQFTVDNAKLIAEQERLKKILDDTTLSTEARLAAAQGLDGINKQLLANEKALNDERLKEAKAALIQEENTSNNYEKVRELRQDIADIIAEEIELESDLSQINQDTAQRRREIAEQEESEEEEKRKKREENAKAKVALQIELAKETERARIANLDSESKRIEAEFQMEREAIIKKYGEGTQLEEELTEAKNKKLIDLQKERNREEEEEEERRLQKLEDIKNQFIPEDEQGLSEAEKFEKERERKREQFEKELEDLKESEEEKARLLREFDEDTTERSIELAEREAQRKKALKEMEVSMALGALSTITNALAEGSDVAKGFAAAEAIWSAYQGINAALADGEIAFPIRVANAVAIGAQAFANVKSIMDTDPQKGGQNINGRGSNQRNVISQSPRFDVVGDSSRLRDLEDEENREPQESYVVSKKVSNQQELDRNKQTNSRFI